MAIVGWVPAGSTAVGATATAVGATGASGWTNSGAAATAVAGGASATGATATAGSAAGASGTAVAPTGRAAPVAQSTPAPACAAGDGSGEACIEPACSGWTARPRAPPRKRLIMVQDEPGRVAFWGHICFTLHCSSG